jgi:hypothetical protein
VGDGDAFSIGSTGFNQSQVVPPLRRPRYRSDEGLSRGFIVTRRSSHSSGYSFPRAISFRFEVFFKPSRNSSSSASVGIGISLQILGRLTLRARPSGNNRLKPTLPVVFRRTSSTKHSQPNQLMPWAQMRQIFLSQIGQISLRVVTLSTFSKNLFVFTDYLLGLNLLQLFFSSNL